MFGSRLYAHIGTFRQLEILLALKQCGSINRAAEQLHLTQPTVSMQLKKLSEAVGEPLYQQQGKKLSLTAAGLAVAETASQVFQNMADLDSRLADIKGLESGVLKIATVTTAKYFIPHLLAPFCEKFPGIDIRLKIGNRGAILKRLHDDEDDLYVFTHPPMEQELVLDEFLPNPLVVVANAQHPLAKQKNIPFSAIEPLPFLMRESGSGTRHAIEEYLFQNQCTVNVKMEIESNEAIKHAVMAGLGISILSKHTLAFGDAQNLVVLDVEGFPMQHKWFLVYPKKPARSLVSQRFQGFIEDEGRAMMLQELNKDTQV